MSNPEYPEIPPEILDGISEEINRKMAEAAEFQKMLEILAAFKLLQEAELDHYAIHWFAERPQLPGFWAVDIEKDDILASVCDKNSPVSAIIATLAEWQARKEADDE
jgi:hypothetical protein